MTDTSFFMIDAKKPCQTNYRLEITCVLGSGFKARSSSCDRYIVKLIPESFVNFRDAAFLGLNFFLATKTQKYKESRKDGIVSNL